MDEAFKTLQALQDTPIPNLLVIGGFFLLFLALVGRIGVIIDLSGKRQWIAGVIGTLLLFCGLGLFILDQQPPSPTDTPTAISQLPTSSPTAAPAATGLLTPTDTPTATTPQPSASPIPLADASWGDTWTRPADGMTMVYVPAGNFQMGSTDDDPDADGDEKPQHEVTLDPFWIDQTEVTNAQYTRCVGAGTCQSSALADDATFNGPDYPVVGVSWQDATDYCQWAGGRLPTEAEWEYAARGRPDRPIDPPIYPWGDTFDGTLANFCDANCSYDSKDINYNDGYEFTAPVGSYPDGASWVGALDMVGNVWEWVNDWYNGYPGTTYQTDDFGTQFKVLRGGGWNNLGAVVRAASRSPHPPDDRSRHKFGIRCVVAPGN